MNGQASRSNSEFITQRDQFLATLDRYIEEFRQWECYFVSAAVLSRGFLEDEGIKKSIKKPSIC